MKSTASSKIYKIGISGFLYASATVVNLVQGFSLTPRLGFVARFGLGLGLCLLVKVVAEDIVYSLAGFWSLDLSERVVREKVGSGLVVVAMLLQLKALDSQATVSFKKGERMRRLKTPNSVQYGMGMLVAVAYGLPFAFFMVQKGQMKFDA